jgi:hypothetical protein
MAGPKHRNTVPGTWQALEALGNVCHLIFCVSFQRVQKLPLKPELCSLTAFSGAFAALQSTDRAVRAGVAQVVEHLPSKTPSPQC